MKLNFWGAAGTTTGSFHLVEANGERFALDCGLFQGRRAISRQMNEEFPCEPSSVGCVVLSHAHIDHIGNLPNFVKQGFEGPIHTQHATADLAKHMLLDSAHIQEKDVYIVNKIRRRKGEAPVEPLYEKHDAEAVLPMFCPANYYMKLNVCKSVEAKFLDAGHILGSAIVQLDIEERGATRRLVFSGDLGRGDNPIIRDPEVPNEADYLIMESTYGNRLHEPREEQGARFLDVLTKTFERGGKVIIPAFSVGRTQEIVYQLNNLFNSGALPRIPCYVDSPLSTNVTEVFKAHPECYNRETSDTLRLDPNPFGFELLHYTRSVEESKALNVSREPCLIIAASGMCEAGRILHHLQHNIEDPKNTVLIVGYQAEHTLGRRIRERHSKVRIFGEEHRLNARVEIFDGFSAHADAAGLKDFAFRVQQRSGGRLKGIYLVHGEDEARLELAEYLRGALDLEVRCPNRGDSFEV